MLKLACGPFTFWGRIAEACDHGKMTIVIWRIDMKTLPAGKFKAQCLALIDDVYEHGGGVLITKRGKPKAKLVPIAERAPESIFGFLKGKVKTAGDIVSPIVESWEWDETVFPAATQRRTEQARTRPERSGRARRRA
jgi:prevent-host-death family protein